MLSRDQSMNINMKILIRL